MKRMIEPTRSQGWPTAVKWLVSILLLGHFFAILTAVLATTPDSLFTRGVWKTAPYLRFVNLTNAYRFYAPEPGPTSMAWFRLQFQDKSVRWLEFPRKEDYFLRMPYQRRLCVGMYIDQNMQPSPTNSMQRVLTPAGRITISSYVRFVANEYSDDSGRVVEEVQVYGVGHGMPAPNQVQIGMETTDLRLYFPAYLGAYTADGTSKAPPGSEEVRDMLGVMDSAILTAQIMENDVYPLLEKNSDKDPWEVLKPMQLPTPIRVLLEKFPDLLDPKGNRGNLAQRITLFVQSRDKPMPNR